MSETTERPHATGEAATETSSARRKTPFGMSITIGGRYRRGARIAQGGSSSVYRATDLTSGAGVALKTFHVHRAFDAALMPALREARDLSDRAGPSAIVPILDVGADDDGTPFVVMPLVPGRTLGDMLDAGAKDAHVALSLARRVLVGIDALHAAGATHGDLAPDNVLVADDGRVLLLDHESLGAIGSARPSRLTQGFGREGGVRERADDHLALAVIASELAGQSAEPPSDAVVEAFVAELRRDDLRAAGAALGWPARSWSERAPGAHRGTRRLLGPALAATLLVLAILVGLVIAWLRVE